MFIWNIKISLTHNLRFEAGSLLKLRQKIVDETQQWYLKCTTGNQMKFQHFNRERAFVSEFRSGSESWSSKYRIIVLFFNAQHPPLLFIPQDAYVNFIAILDDEMRPYSRFA